MDAAVPSGLDVVTAEKFDAELARRAAASVVDPEIPVLTIEDLGILRSVEVGPAGSVVVSITPTYSGCPAMRQIAGDVEEAVRKSGATDVEVRTVYHPPWSTSDMTAAGRRKLEEFGIAPPGSEARLTCPRCSSSDPRVVSRFGSTACKALMACASCGEPFDYFKAVP